MFGFGDRTRLRKPKPSETRNVGDNLTMKDTTTNKILILLFTGIALVIFAPYIFTRELGLISFKDTGTIGDTIGGITAPITSLIGSTLVYFALKAQIDANRLIQNQIETQRAEDIVRKKIQYLNEQVNLVRSDINEFSYSYKESVRGETSDRKQKFNYLGADAINEFIESLRYVGEKHEEDVFKTNPKLTELLNLLDIIKSLLAKIEATDIPTDDKQFFKSLISYQFNSKVRPAFTTNEKHRTKNTKVCDKCGKHHFGIPDKLFDLVDEIVSLS